MKSVKYTLAALAIIALASVGAKAQQTGAPGEIVLGVFNNTNSLQFDLGAYNTLSSGESWDLGNVTTAAGSNLSFSLAAATSGSTNSAGGLPKGGIALAGINITTQTSVTSQIGAITEVEENITANPVAASNGHSSYFENLEVAGQSPSYAFEDGGNGFGGSSSIDEVWTGNDTANLYTLVKNGSPIEIGTFSTVTTSGDTILTFNTLGATPEPSAYALGLCAVALFFVLKRRSKVA